jgi:hypothetical protein
LDFAELEFAVLIGGTDASVDGRAHWPVQGIHVSSPRWTPLLFRTGRS